MTATPLGPHITATAPLVATGTFPQNLSISEASTSVAGVVRLENSVNCDSFNLAATANSVRITHELASSAATTSTTALTTANLAKSTASMKISCSCFLSSATILVGTGPATFTALSPGPVGSMLVRDNACVGGLKWVLGASGQFTSQDGKTVTVTNGLITSIS